MLSGDIKLELLQFTTACKIVAGTGRVVGWLLEPVRKKDPSHSLFCTDWVIYPSFTRHKKIAVLVTIAILF